MIYPRVLVDTVPIVPGKTSVGVQVYLMELLEAIPSAAREQMTLLCTRSNVASFTALEGYRCTVLPWTVEKRSVRVLTQQLAVPFVAAYADVDVLFEPIDTAAILAPVPIVTSMHSSHINMENEQMGVLRRQYNERFLRWTAHRSTRMIAISQFVKDSLVEILDVESRNIDVVYHGGGVVERAQRQGWLANSQERDGGILFVSTLYPHKNAEMLIRAYARLANERNDLPPLHIVGGDTDGERPVESGTEQTRLMRLAHCLDVGESVKSLGRVSDEQLLHLFATSRLMVFPSSLEGFGLPALEAMQAGLPLVASNKTSVPEIVGEGGLVIDPTSEQAMAEAIEQALFDESTRAQLKEKGYSRGAQFSWERTAKETLQVLKEAVAS